jgi:hypothetical protein
MAFEQPIAYTVRIQESGSEGPGGFAIAENSNLNATIGASRRFSPLMLEHESSTIPDLEAYSSP